MPAPDVAVTHYRTQRRLALNAMLGARHLWGQVQPADFDGSWSRVAQRMQALLTLAQARAAVDGTAYVTDVLAAQGIDAAPDGNVEPAKLAGVASSGADLATLLYGPIITAKQFVLQGLTGAAALTQARSVLDGIMLTQVADAGRVATGTATVARPGVDGYMRMLTRPSCSRCVVLAGKFYKWDAGFLRHPRCDCVHIPTVENVAGDSRTDPAAYFDSLTSQQQSATFGQAGAQAIRDGSDISRVVNARSGIYTASTSGRTVRATHAGAKKRLRLMPEQIYTDATSRADAIRLLRHYGYIT